jgi:DNA-binding GntR family transcriptional regulator
MPNSITETLRVRIIRLHYRPGDPLNEKKLAEELNVSRTPIREALIRLSQENLVTLSPYSMARVSDINLRNFQELIHCRLILERGIARLSVLNVTEGEIRELEKLQKRINQITEEDSAAFVRHDEELHRLVRKAAANTFLDSYLSNVQDHFTRIQYLMAHRPTKERMNDELAQVIDALKTRNQEKMETLLVEHVERFVAVVRNHFRIY